MPAKREIKSNYHPPQGIADTFTDNLAKLNNYEQKAVKTTVFDLQLNPANTGMQFYKLTKLSQQGIGIKINS